MFVKLYGFFIKIAANELDLLSQWFCKKYLANPAKYPAGIYLFLKSTMEPWTGFTYCSRVFIDFEQLNVGWIEHTISLGMPYSGKSIYNSVPAGIYMFKVNNRNTRTRCELCSKLTITIPERRPASFWYRYC